MPRRVHDPAGIQSSRFTWPKAYLRRNVRLPFDRAARSRLAQDVRREAEHDEMRQLASDVDVAAGHAELAGVDGVAVGVGNLRTLRVGVVGVESGAYPDGGRIISARRRRSRLLRPCGRSGQRQRDAANAHQRQQPDKKSQDVSSHHGRRSLPASLRRTSPLCVSRRCLVCYMFVNSTPALRDALPVRKIGT